MQLLYTLKNFGKNIINTATAVRIRAVANLVKSADLICRILLTLVFRGPLPRHSCGKIPTCSAPLWGEVTRCPYALISLCAVSAPSQKLPYFHIGHTSVQQQQDHWKSNVKNFAASRQGAPPPFWLFGQLWKKEWQYTAWGWDELENTPPPQCAPLGPQDCPRAISQASGCKLPQGAYFLIHPSPRQCIMSSVRSSNSHPDLLLIQQHPTFSDHTGPQHWTFTF